MLCIVQNRSDKNSILKQKFRTITCLRSRSMQLTDFVCTQYQLSSSSLIQNGDIQTKINCVNELMLFDVYFGM